MRARGARVPGCTPKGRLNKLEAALAARAWHAARPEVRVKLLPEDGDLYVYVESQARIGKERSMRRKRFKRYWARLKELQRQRPAYSTLLMKLGAAAHDAGRTRTLAKVTLPEAPPRGEREKRVDFTFTLDRAALKRSAAAKVAICCART